MLFPLSPLSASVARSQGFFANKATMVERRGFFCFKKLLAASLGEEFIPLLLLIAKKTKKRALQGHFVLQGFLFLLFFSYFCRRSTDCV